VGHPATVRWWVRGTSGSRPACGAGAQRPGLRTVAPPTGARHVRRGPGGTRSRAAGAAARDLGSPRPAAGTRPRPHRRGWRAVRSAAEPDGGRSLMLAEPVLATLRRASAGWVAARSTFNPGQTSLKRHGPYFPPRAPRAALLAGTAPDRARRSAGVLVGRSWHLIAHEDSVFRTRRLGRSRRPTITSAAGARDPGSALPSLHGLTDRRPASAVGLRVPESAGAESAGLHGLRRRTSLRMRPGAASGAMT